MKIAKVFPIVAKSLFWGLLRGTIYVKLDKDIFKNGSAMLRFDSILGGEDEQISPGKVPISASLYACFVISDGLRCRFFFEGTLPL